MEDNNAEEARKLRVRLSSSGAWHSVGTVLSKLVAKHVKSLETGLNHYTKAQWTDRMTARNADAKKAEDCWNRACDMAGNFYARVEWKGVPYIVADKVLSLTEQKLLERNLSTDEQRIKPSQASLLQEFADPDLGFVATANGGHQASPITSFALGGAYVQDVARPSGGCSLRRSNAVEDFGMELNEEDDPALVNDCPDVMAEQISPSSGGNQGRRVLQTTPQPGKRASKAGSRAVRGGYTAPPMKRKTLVALSGEISMLRVDTILTKDVEVDNIAYYCREYLKLIIKRDWMVVRFVRWARK